MIRVLVADESDVVITNLTRRLALEEDLEVCGSAHDGEAAVQEALRLQPDIAIVDAGLPGMDGGQTTEMLRQFVPGTGVIMISMEAEKDAYRLAMLAGAREFLQKPFKGDDLVAAVRRVHEFEQRSAAATAAVTTSATPVATLHEVTSPPPPIAAAPQAPPSVTCVVSGRGGVGKTVLAANLAVALAAGGTKRVVLVDLSLQFGDVAATLNLTSEHNIAELVSAGVEADHDLLLQVMQAGPGGIRVLLAPNSPELAEYVTAAHVRAVIDELRTIADHVVIDTATALNEVTLCALEAADQVVLVTDLSVPGVKNSRLFRGLLELLKVQPAHVIAVANHRESAGELDRSGAESFLGMRLTLEVPFEPRVVATSIADGVPFVLRNPESASAEAVRNLATLVDPTSQNSSDASRQPDPADKKRRSRRMFGLSRA